MPQTITDAAATLTMPTKKRRRRRRMRSSAVPTATRPHTADVCVQTNPLPSPPPTPQMEKASVQAASQSYAAVVQTGQDELFSVASELFVRFYFERTRAMENYYSDSFSADEGDYAAANEEHQEMARQSPLR